MPGLRLLLELFLLCCLAIAVEAASGKSAGKVNCSIEALDEASKDLELYNRRSSMTVVSEEDAFAEECTMLYASLEATERYETNCSQGFGQAMIKLFVDAAAKEITDRCDGPGKAEYLKMTPCLVDKAGADLRKCNRRLSGYLQATLEQERQNRIPLVCCFQAEYERCLLRAARKCGEDHAQYLSKVISEMTDDLTDMACYRYTRQPALCKALPAVTPVENPKYRTMLPFLVQVLQSVSA